MLLSLDEAKENIKYYKIAQPEQYEELGGNKINDDTIKEALEITEAISAGLSLSEDEVFKRELKRICNTNKEGN